MYAVFDPLTGKYFFVEDIEDAKILRVNIFNNINNKLIQSKTDLKLLDIDNSKIASDYLGIDVNYVCSVFNYTLQKDIGSIFTGILNNNINLIKVINGEVVEHSIVNYFDNNGVRYQCVSIDTKTKIPLEYYQNSDNDRACICKYSWSTKEHLLDIHIGPIPDIRSDIVFNAFQVRSWFDSIDGFIIEYIKSCDRNTDEYKKVFTQIHNELVEQIKNNYTVSLVTYTNDGDVWETVDVSDWKL